MGKRSNFERREADFYLARGRSGIAQYVDHHHDTTATTQPPTVQDTIVNGYQ